MEVTEYAQVGDGWNITIKATSQEMHAFGHQVLAGALKLAAQKIAEEFVKTKGTEMIAAIPTQAVTNLVVAESVKKISKASTED